VKLDVELLFMKMVQVAHDVQVTPFYGTMVILNSKWLKTVKT